jgi:O-antigen/teichoic acid export membrane protein
MLPVTPEESTSLNSSQPVAFVTWRSRVKEWSRLGFAIGTAQAAVQIIGFVSGILIVQLLSPEQFGLYILAYTMVGAISVLSDSGIGNGVMSEGGKVWRDPILLGSVIATGLSLRKLFGIISAVCSLPVLIWLFKRQGATLPDIILLLAALFPLISASLTQSILQVAPKLGQRVAAIQKIDIKSNFFRLVLLIPSLVLIPYAAVAIFCTGIVQYLTNSHYRKLTKELCHSEQKTNSVVQKQILYQVKRTLPSTIYFCFSGQISIWLISIFGTTQALAEVGALSRLAAGFSLFSAFTLYIIAPRFSRLQNERSLLLPRFLYVHAGYILLVITITMVAYIFPEPALMILGGNYAHVTPYIALAAAGAGLSLMSQLTNTLSAGRGWIISPWLVITCMLLVQVSSCVLLPIGTVYGVLLLGAGTSAAMFLLRFSYSLYTILRLPLHQRS